MPAQPPPLLDELVEEVLLRLPPHEPADLVRAALVCRSWRRLVSDAGFRRRFREFHRRPPVLGMICSRYDKLGARFVPTTAFRCSPQAAADRGDLRALDARHGRLLLAGRRSVVVWDPIADEERKLPVPEWESVFEGAAVLCSAAAGAGAGECDHLGCHRGPFLVVFVCSRVQSDETLVYTYSSDAAAWGDPVCAQQHGYKVDFMMGSALVANSIYFGSLSGTTTLRYNLELRHMSWIQLPHESQTWMSVLTTTEDGALGLAAKHHSRLYLWSRKDTAATWEKRVVIELNTLFPVGVFLIGVSVVGSADGLGIIFLRVDDVVYTLDLKTYKLTKVYEGTPDIVVPYTSFYTPALIS